MWIAGTVAGLGLILLTLIDGFETILQPRRVTHRFRFARLFYRGTWRVWRAAAMLIRAGRAREAYLSVFGPLSLLGLFATWVFGLIVGFGVLHWSLGTILHAPDSQVTIWTYLYLSGTTFFTLGYGDVTPAHSPGRALAVIEAGLGFAFLAVLIAYLPVLYQAFSRREVTISLLDARAGSPPSAAQVLIRVARSGQVASLDALLASWEKWAAELLESHLSFPVLSYYRSQHDNQSWLAALTVMLDTSAILIARVKQASSHQAQLTFAMARHAAVDLALVFKIPPQPTAEDRLADGQRLASMLKEAGVELVEGAEADARYVELRAMYEPFVNALARRFVLALPPIAPEGTPVDNWQRSAWMQKTPGIGNLATVDEEHFA